MKTRHLLVGCALTVLGACGPAGFAVAQLAAGSTTAGPRITESTPQAMGWSVKKTLLGKTVYNDQGQKVGQVEDLLIAHDKNLPFVIVGAGGFVGIGRHDVAVPLAQIQDHAGRLVMAGASRDSIKAMPAFAYTTEVASRESFTAAADKDIAKGRAALASLEKKADAASAEVKARLDLEVAALQTDLKSAESKLSGMRHATAERWKEFQGEVSAATARVRKAIDKATS